MYKYTSISIRCEKTVDFDTYFTSYRSRVQMTTTKISYTKSYVGSSDLDQFLIQVGRQDSVPQPGASRNCNRHLKLKYVWNFKRFF